MRNAALVLGFLLLIAVPAEAAERGGGGLEVHGVALSQDTVLADEALRLRVFSRDARRLRLRVAGARSRTFRVRAGKARTVRLLLTRAGRVRLAGDRAACRPTVLVLRAHERRGRTWRLVRRQRLTFPASSCPAAPAPNGGGAQPGGGSAPGPDPSTWRRTEERYAVVEESNVEVRMSDGVILRADIHRPADPKTGKPAEGPFPVLLALTPYKKSSRLTTSYASRYGDGGSGVFGGDGYYPYLVRRGYINVIVDLRGTGSSDGLWNLQDANEQRDGAELVDWAAHRIEGSNGEIGLVGASYLGGNQYPTAALVGRNSPVKAMAPTVPAFDQYRDFMYPGGFFLRTFMNFFLFGSRHATSDFTPPEHLGTQPVQALSVLLQHGGSLVGHTVPAAIDLNSGGTLRHDGPYWRFRDWGSMVPRIVDNGIPALVIGGHWDVFQRGAPLHLSAFQNAWAGRRYDRPMRPGQPATPRYQAVIGPWYHLNSFQEERYQQILLEWFDTWMKGEDTAFRRARSPLHVYDLGTDKWVDSPAYPHPSTRVRTLFLDGEASGSARSLNDGSLSDVPPAAPGADQLPHTQAPVECSRQQEQWAAGIPSFSAFNSGVPANSVNPCLGDDRPGQARALTYTTEPLDGASALVGPITATLFASSTRPNAAFVVYVEDVAPDGTSYPLTHGLLMGNLRSTDPDRNWELDGKLVLPHHPSRPADDRPLEAGKVERFDVEVFPTVATLERDHRLRVTITTSLDPLLTPVSPREYADLEGAVHAIQHGGAHPSHVNVPLVPVSELRASPRDYGTCNGGC